MNLATLISRLGTSRGLDRFPLVSSSQGLSYCPAPFPDYVGPDLKTRDDVAGENEPSIVLVSAPGAVGKTAFAKELAYRTKALYWDLAACRTVAAGFVKGTLLDNVGQDKIGQALAYIQSGEFLNVVDAFDEARIKTTEGGFNDFLNDIAVIAGSKPPAKFVLIGRTQVAEHMYLALAERGCRVKFIEILPFDEQQRREYVYKKVGKDPAARSRMTAHRGPFEDAYKAVCRKLRTALQGEVRTEEDERTKAFLGYAPVLDAISVLLRTEPNYVALSEELEKPRNLIDSAAGTAGALEMLKSVVERIMSREKEEKLERNIRPALSGRAGDWSDWNSLYSHDEQCRRLLSLRLGARSNLALTLPESMRSFYEEQVSIFIREHPFLINGNAFANSVFESYLLARALRGHFQDMAEAAIEFVRQPSYKPNKLLADFYVGSDRNTGNLVVPANHVGVLWESYLAAESDRLRIGVAIDGGSPEDEGEAGSGNADAELWFESPLLSGVEMDADCVRFHVPVAREDTICFHGRLQNASVIVPCNVAFGIGRPECVIGPNVYVRCSRLDIKSSSLIVATDKQFSDDVIGDEVVLEADDCTHQLGREPVVRGKLSVSWSGCRAWPWTEWATEARGKRGHDEMAQVFHRIRRIALTLRKHGRGRLAKYRNKVESTRVIGVDGRWVLDRLVADGILSLEGSKYVADIDVADKLLGTSWGQFKVGKITERMSAYIRQILRDKNGEN